MDIGQYKNTELPAAAVWHVMGCWNTFLYHALCLASWCRSEGERSSKLGNLLQPPKLFSQSLELFANYVGIWCTETRLK